MLVWMLRGKQAGRFVPVTQEEGAALIAAGDAQPANIPATLIRRPEYGTREMRASQDAPKPKTKRKRKPRAKTKVTDNAAA